MGKVILIGIIVFIFVVCCFTTWIYSTFKDFDEKAGPGL